MKSLPVREVVILLAWRVNPKAIGGVEVNTILCPNLQQAIVWQDALKLYDWQVRVEQGEYLPTKPSLEMFS